MMIHWGDKIFLVRLHHREITINLLTEQNCWLVIAENIPFFLLNFNQLSRINYQLRSLIRLNLNTDYSKQTTKSTRRTIYVYGAQRFPHLSSHPRLRMVKSFYIEASLILTLTWRRRRERAWWCTRRTPGTYSGRMSLCYTPGLNN